MKRNHDDQKEAAAFFKKMMKGEVTVKSGSQANVDTVVEITELNSAEEAKREIGKELSDLYLLSTVCSNEYQQVFDV